jgi:hypothetical protein
MTTILQILSTIRYSNIYSLELLQEKFGEDVQLTINLGIQKDIFIKTKNKLIILSTKGERLLHSFDNIIDLI